MPCEVLTSGYVSMDHIIRIATPACVGKTSIVTNSDNMCVNYGGCGTNIAVSLCRLGKSAMPVLRVGRDWEGNGFRRYLEESKVPLDGISVLENESTSTCYLIEDTDGNHITCYYPGSMDGKYAKKPDSSLFEGVKLGVITVGSEADNTYFLDSCLERDIPVVFGMRIDPDAFPEHFLRRLLAESSIIFSNETEWDYIEKLYAEKNPEKLISGWRARIVVVTLGAGGSLCYERTDSGIKKHNIPAYHIEKIVDATGAGDAYMAGFIYGLLNHEDTGKCCALGSAMSSFILQAVGCTTNVPSPEELEKRAAQLTAKPVWRASSSSGF